MKTAAKILYFYGLWYFCAVAGRENYHLVALGVSLTSLLVDYAIFRYPLGPLRYFSFVLFLMISGPLLDLSFKYLGLMDWEGPFYPLSILAIWGFFAVYYPTLFQVFRKRLVLSFFLGGIFGPLAYYSGHLIGSLKINTEYAALAFAFSVCWGLYFAFSLKLFDWLDRASSK
jgi:hypothetical protein